MRITAGRRGNWSEDAYQRRHRRADAAPLCGGGEHGSIGFFAEDDWQAGALTLTGGLRADRYTIADGYFRRVSPAGVVTQNDAFATRSDWEVTWRGGVLVRAMMP